MWGSREGGRIAEGGGPTQDCKEHVEVVGHLSNMIYVFFACYGGGASIRVVEGYMGGEGQARSGALAPGSVLKSGLLFLLLLVCVLGGGGGG